MKAEQRELFRLALLRVFDANNTRYGLSLPAVCHLVQTFGFFSPQPEEAERELIYLEDKGYIEQLSKPISPENRLWRINAAGRDIVAIITIP